MVCSLSARSLSSQGFSIVVRRLIAFLGCAGAVLAVTIAQAGKPAVEYKGATYIQAGKTWTCYAPHKKTGEIVPVKGMKVPLFSAWSGVMYDGAGYLIRTEGEPRPGRAKVCRAPNGAIQPPLRRLVER